MHLSNENLRRNAKLKRESGDPVARQVGTLTDRQKMNMTSSLLATERANRDESGHLERSASSR